MNDGLYIVLISVHGLIRAHQPELGRDADTGGQVKYVIELARALAAHPDVARVDLLTRRVIDPRIAPDYARAAERLAPRAYLIRIPCGPRRYLRKEVLWSHLDSFADQAVLHFRRMGRLPDVIHGHYADGGYVGARLAGVLGVPLVFTGHSLGRVKRQRLLDQGVRPEVIEGRYNITRRIEAEEFVLDNAAFVVASTRQEVAEQYSLYDDYQPRRIAVIPPGMDLERFHPPRRGEHDPPIKREIDRFLRHPRRPMLLALARPDARKNLATLVRAYGEHPRLREFANLVIVAGNRDDLAAMEKGPREVLTELLLLMDRYDLYGHFALPKHHAASEVPAIYRLAARTGGVFVNPALTEPFGLTLIEAAASGLPVVATEHGGPQDIVHHCRNGVLVDPLDVRRLGEVLEEALTNRAQWRRWSRNGVLGAHRHFSWPGHVEKYVRRVKRLLGGAARDRARRARRSRLPVIDRVLVCDVDNTLIGDAEALRVLLERLRAGDGHVGFGVATGRGLPSTLRALKEWGVPLPDVIISAVGSEIHYGPRVVEDTGWSSHIDYRWEPQAIREALGELPGLRLQPREGQRRHKISYFVDPMRWPGLRAVRRHLRKRDLHAHVVYSHDAYLDILPVRASKGAALRYFADKWGLRVDRVLVVGDSGNDEEMLRGDTLGAVVANHAPELDALRGEPRIYFARGHHAWGVLEAIEHYDFFGDIRAEAEQDVAEAAGGLGFGVRDAAKWR